MDTASVYTVSVLAPQYDSLGELRTETIQLLKEFILTFQIDNTYIYRDQLRSNALTGNYFCDIDIAHLTAYNEELTYKLTNEPNKTISLFEEALRQCTQRIIYPQNPTVKIPSHQLMLHSSIDHVSIRDLTADNVSALVRIPGIVIGASTLSSKATSLSIQCRRCQHTESLPVESGFTGVTLPRTCGRKKMPGVQEEPCPLDPYFIVHEDSEFQDQQILKIQEAPDQVPVGELPRHIVVSADRYLANRVIPGSRCTIMGIYSIYSTPKSTQSKSSAVAIRNPYVRAVGIQTSTSATSSLQSFTDAETLQFEALSRRPDIYSLLTSCIAPSIYGNTDIKRAIACLLFGGSKKSLPDGARLRGDINVLLLGDPGTAKSQLLKFVSQCAPICIYTSGKGSSAAGLTASVQRDTQSREFYLEGGAMVLADNGVVCIDEFDKMRDEDRVAIHEAMEQQTISIAKAGITTILNARTSVLAAANPIFGRYDDLKSPGENIDFQTTILSRFDMIFIVRDDHDRNRDETIARHVMNIHMGGNASSNTASDENQSEIPVDTLKRYISFAKSRCAPRLSPEASEKLSSHFVTIRAQTARHEKGAGAKSSIPITIRQLEAIVRITESLAKMSLSPIAEERHVDEAIRLFLASTMDAVTHERSAYGLPNPTANNNGGNRDVAVEVGRLEEELKKRIPIGWSASLSTLKREFCGQRGYSEGALGRVLGIMQRRESVRMRSGGGVVWRCGV